MKQKYSKHNQRCEISGVWRVAGRKVCIPNKNNILYGCYFTFKTPHPNTRTIIVVMIVNVVPVRPNLTIVRIEVRPNSTNLAVNFFACYSMYYYRRINSRPLYSMPKLHSNKQFASGFLKFCSPKSIYNNSRNDSCYCIFMGHL